MTLKVMFLRRRKVFLLNTGNWIAEFMVFITVEGKNEGE